MRERTPDEMYHRGVTISVLKERQISDCLNCKMKQCFGCPIDRDRQEGTNKYMNAKEKSDLRTLRYLIQRWPEGYYCFICGNPIEEGKLCSKHKNFFNKALIEEADKRMEEIINA